MFTSTGQHPQNIIERFFTKEQPMEDLDSQIDQTSISQLYSNYGKVGELDLIM